MLFDDVAQEYTEEFRDITKGTKSKESLPVAPITLINQRPVGDDLHVRMLVLSILILPSKSAFVT